VSEEERGKTSVRARAGTLFALLGVGALGVLLLFSLRDYLSAHRSSSSQVRYATGVVREGTIEVLASGAGTVTWSSRYSVGAEVSGTVKAVHVGLGDRVEKGQVLVELENEDLVFAVQASRLQLEQARQRIRAVSGEAAVDLSGRAEVRASSWGRLTGLRVREGDQVQKGAVLATLVDTQKVEFVAGVLGPERERIRPGDRATVRLERFEGELSGTVSEVETAPVTGETSQLYRVHITLPNPGLLQAGMAGQTTIEAQGGPVLRTGELAWARRGLVTAPIAGLVTELGVTEGQEVQKGQLLAVIVNQSLPLELEQLRLQVAQAELDLKNKLASLEKLVIRAPESGVVVALNVKKGDRVGPGGVSSSTGSSPSELLALASEGEAVATVALDELEVARVQVGQEAEVTLPALPGKKFRGRVTRLAPEGRSQNGVTVFDVEIKVERPEGVRAGMTANASIRVARKEGVLLVPVEAVSTGPRGTTVRVLRGNAPQEVPVSLGLQNDQVAEVISGLRAGDRVVLAEFNPSTSTPVMGGRPGQQGPPFPGRGLMGPGGFGPGFRPGGGGGGSAGPR